VHGNPGPAGHLGDVTVGTRPQHRIPDVVGERVLQHPEPGHRAPYLPYSFTSNVKEGVVPPTVHRTRSLSVNSPVTSTAWTATAVFCVKVAIVFHVRAAVEGVLDDDVQGRRGARCGS
jgi:hypothetical protein